MNSEKKPKDPLRVTFILLSALLLISALWLRLANLGYSNLQGDEIKTLCQPAAHQSLANFLLEQRKGPVQFLITCANRIFDPTFSNIFALRLPFAAANIAAIFVFFLLVKRLFGGSTGLYAGLFLATNGLIVAFGRIVQYQSITILCTLLGLYGLTLAVQDEKWNISGLYLGFIAAAVGILAHFDGVFVLPPMGYLVYEWLRKYRATPGYARSRIHILAAGGIFAVLLAGFYIPYILHLNATQLEYWQERLTGASRNTLPLFRFYNPGPILWVYLALVVLGLFQLRKNSASFLLITWLVPPLIFIEILMSDPRTHFYTYLLPLLVLAALGIETIRGWLSRLFKRDLNQIVQLGCLVLFGFLFSLTNVILVDHNPEYPWQPKAFLNMALPGGDIQGAFGFPYYRPWKEIAAWITQNHPGNADYTTNEKSSISTFYMPQRLQYKEIDQEYYDQMGKDSGIFIIMIENPQSWVTTLWGQSVDQVNQSVKPVKVFLDENGRLQATLYYMTKADIQLVHR